MVQDQAFGVNNIQLFKVINLQHMGKLLYCEWLRKRGNLVQKKKQAKHSDWSVIKESRR